MALNVGSRIAHYDVTAKLGEGGMGEVWRATDTQLNRDVALKILPEAFASDPDRLARFQREAQVLASLNHPNIAQIHGIEEDEGTRALVLELVEGPTLADRISKGPIPLDEALPIAKQIAEALEAAHEAGVIHLDLKPTNIKIREDGTVKVLDFGLAKALDPSPTRDPSESPTLTAAATQMGVIMGTAAYMSPEQARGKPVDKRADIWSFGVVLYEMLTGQRAFQGGDVSVILADVIRADLKWEKLPNDLPPTLATYLRRCLEKEPSRRIRDIGDVRLAMEGAFDTTSATSAEPRVEPTPGRTTPERVWMATTVLATLLALALAVPYFTATPTVPTAVRFSVETATSDLGGFALSPDGTQLVFVAGDQLWLRMIGELDAQMLPGTENASFPFWSPDGRSIGFFASTELRTVDLTGGPPQTVCPVVSALGGTWNQDDVIMFGQFSGGLVRVSAHGGEPTPLVEPESGGLYAWPQFLPDGDHFLFLANSTVPQESGIRIGSLETGSVSSPILQSGSAARYAAPGYLLFERDGTLMAQRFDLERLEVTGDPVRVADSVVSLPVVGYTGFSTSDQGGLTYATAAQSPLTQLRLLDRTGTELRTVGPPGDYENPVLSRDEARVAVQRDGDIWLLDLMRETDQRFTFASEPDRWPTWSPDGDRLLFVSSRDTGQGIYEKETAGTTPPQLLLETNPPTVLSDWSPDGEVVAYHDFTQLFDLWLLPMSGDRQPTSFLSTPFQDAWGVVSPDSRWLAYASDEAGEWRVYLRSVSGGGQWQISTGQAVRPRWRGDGRELFYDTYDQEQVMAVEIDVSGDAPVIGTPQLLFQVPFRRPAGSQRNVFDVTPDGQRFLVNTRLEGEDSGAQINWIVNWAAELDR